MHIHRSVIAGVGIAPHQVHQILAAVNTAGIFHQKLHQVIFFGCQVDDLAASDHGTLLGIQVMPAAYLPMDLLVKPAGGFIVFGLMMALMNKLLPKKA